MTKGCVFFNFGTLYVVRLLVAIHSLRAHYSGPVSVLMTDDPDNDRLRDTLGRLDVPTVVVESLSKSFDRHELFLATPYDLTLAFDSDLIFRAPIEPLWEPIDKVGLVVTRFHAPPHGVEGTAQQPGFADRMAYLAGVRHLIGEDLYRHAARRLLQDRMDVNIGVMGVSKSRGAAFTADLADHLRRGRHAAIMLLDEMLVVGLLGRFPHVLLGEEWNCPADEFFRRTNLADAKIIHYFAEGNAVGGIPLGRNPDSWAGKIWHRAYRKAARDIDLTPWLPHDPAFRPQVR